MAVAAPDLDSVFEVAHGTESLTTLASFTGGADGGDPLAGVVLDPSDNLYGTNVGGKNGVTSASGTVFEIAHGTKAITTLVTFNNKANGQPRTGVTLDASGDLYGTTFDRGTNSIGTVFEVAKGTATATTLTPFVVTGGFDPNGALVMDASGNLYGTASEGGTSNDGTIFELASGRLQVHDGQLLQRDQRPVP